MAKAPKERSEALKDLNPEKSLTELEADAVRGGDEKKKKQEFHPVVIQIISVLIGT